MMTNKLPISIIINVLVFFFGALVLTIHSGYSYAPAALAVMSIPFLFCKSTYQLNRRQLIFIASLLFYIAILLLSHIRENDLNGRELEHPARVLAIIAVFLLLYQKKFLFQSIIYGFLAGAVIAGSLAMYEKFILGSARAFSVLDRSYVIQAGDISMSLALVCATVAIYFYRQKNHLQLGLFITGSAFGIIASLLSGTRGGWVFFPVIIFVFYRMYRHFLTKNAKLTGLAILGALILFCAIPQVGVTTRIHHAINDISLFMEGKNKNTSLGVRFQLWHGAWLNFKERPIFGWGDKTLDEAKQVRLKEGVISPFIYHSRYHAHNEYLDEMQKRGLIGLIALLAIFIIPFYLFRRAFKQSEDPKVQTIASAGIMIVLSTMDFCFSQAFFKHVSGIMFYFTSIAIFMAYCYHKDHNTKTPY